jgi:glycosyltransferase involved in cell wall biosynthesis
MKAYLSSMLGEDLNGSVSFHGHVTRKQVFSALTTARLAVFPSYAEAFAIAPLEAMASGCPTVYSNRGSGSELIEHERTGLLVDPDRPLEIAAAIGRLLKDDDLARRIGLEGQRHVGSKFSIVKLLEENIAFYRSCVDRYGQYKQQPGMGH